MKYFLSFLFFSSAAVAQNFDVLLYKDAPNPNEIPTNWPARVQSAAGRTAPWILMSAAQLETQKSNALPAYVTWEQNFRHTNAVAQARQQIEEFIASDPMWVAIFKALSRGWASELSQVRTNPTAVQSARTQNQILNALRQHVTDILVEDLTTNTVPLPP